MKEFDEVKTAALEYRERFHPHCEESYVDINSCVDMEDLRRVAIKYKGYIADDATVLRKEYADYLDAVGLSVNVVLLNPLKHKVTLL